MLFCSFWLLLTLPSYLWKHHMNKFAGPDPENFLDFADSRNNREIMDEELWKISYNSID